ncbi:DnaD domain protein [Domibacillus aminovorans]|uniref:DnaD domain-containing protein n=1 Tax=Domibacillus aminovorans TaxID=29332 RepID=UPI003D1CAE4C
MGTGSEAVDRIGQLNIQGNVIPPYWYKNMTYKNGKPNFVAITILSDIVYWYRPTIERDEVSGQVVKIRKKFKADMLQRNYQAFADQFGFTKRQVKEAIDYLEEHRFIKREFRNLTTAAGVKVNNVLYVEPIAQTIEQVTISECNIHQLEDEEHTSESTPSYVETCHPIHSDEPPSYVGTEDPPTPERRTNTEITTNSSTDLKKEIKKDARMKDCSELVRFFENNGFGTIGSYVSERLMAWRDDLSKELVLYAMKLSVENGQCRWSYVESILVDWAQKKLTTVEQVKAARLAFKQQSNSKKAGTRRSGPTRQEKLPDWYRKTADDPAPVAESDDYDFEAEKAKLEAELKKE